MAKGTRKAPAPKLDSTGPARAPMRLDGWANAATGLGVLGKDKRLSVSYSPDLLDPLTCEALWRGNDLAARIVELIPDEALREGIEFCTDDNEFDELIEDDMVRLKGIETLRDAWQTARALGGAGILVGANDGSSNLALPLTEDRIRTVDFLTVLTPRELWAVDWYSDPAKPKYGEVATYRLVPSSVPPDSKNIGNFPVVHESRIIRMSGVRTTRRYRYSGTQPGWDDSMLARVVESLSDFQGAFAGAALLAADFSFAVLKIKGLAELLATTTGQDLVKRAAGIEAARSVANVTILDEAEEYERKTTAISGLPELLEKLMLRLAAAAKIPVALLMGQGPSGLNATGEADMRWFYDQVKAEQRRIARPALKRLFTLILAAKFGPAKGVLPEKWDFEFNPLWQLTEKEEADVRLTQATVDEKYIAAQVVTPQEISKSRFGGEKYSTETQIDMALREELLGDEDLQLSALGAAPEGGPAVDPLEAAQAAALQTKTDPADPKEGPAKPTPKARGDEWNEEDHPRAENGQFGEGSGERTQGLSPKTKFVMELGPEKKLSEFKTKKEAVAAGMAARRAGQEAFVHSTETYLKHINPRAYVEPTVGEIGVHGSRDAAIAAKAAKAGAAAGKPAVRAVPTARHTPESVRAIATNAPHSEKFGDDKVFIRHLMANGVSKESLAEMHRAGQVTLARADLVDIMDVQQVRESEVSFSGATFHFIRTDR